MFGNEMPASLGVGVGGEEFREAEREFFIDNPLVRMHFVVEMILVDWLRGIGGEESMRQ